MRDLTLTHRTEPNGPPMEMARRGGGVTLFLVFASFAMSLPPP